MIKLKNKKGLIAFAALIVIAILGTIFIRPSNTTNDSVSSAKKINYENIESDLSTNISTIDLSADRQIIQFYYHDCDTCKIVRKSVYTALSKHDTAEPVNISEYSATAFYSKPIIAKYGKSGKPLAILIDNKKHTAYTITSVEEKDKTTLPNYISNKLDLTDERK